MEISPEKILVIGVGNEKRGDDGVGLLAARRLLEKKLMGFGICELRGDPTLLLELWENAETVFLIDAVCSGAAPGTVHRFDGRGIPRVEANVFRFSTHGTNIVEVIELARALKRLPKRLVIYGIEGKAFGIDQPVSPEAARGKDKAIAAILKEVHETQPERKHA